MAIPQRANRLSIPGLLEHRAVENSDRSVLIGQKREPLSFGRLFDQTREVVGNLNALGVGRNDRVAAVLPNGPEMAAAFLTIASCASFAPLNPAYRANEFDFFLSDLNPNALLVQAGTSSPALEVARNKGIPVIELLPLESNAAGCFWLRGGGCSRAVQPGFAEPDDIALLLHTSGTTSRPKMVPLSHSNLLASAQSVAASLSLTEEDRCLGLMPLFHIHGLVGAILSSVVAGASIVCTKGFNAPEVLGWLAMYLPSWFTAVPTMLQAILGRVKDAPKTKAPSGLRLIRSCSAPLPAKILMELEGIFNVPVIEAYGMTEASHQIASNPLPPRQRKLGSVGTATGTEIAIMSETGVILPQGQTGEIVVRGHGVTRGYENNPAANVSAFVHGWFRTGDLGYCDEDGYLFITGRLKEIINRGGEKISPAEVDNALMHHPAVAEAATFPVSHGQLGEEIAAAVVLRTDASCTVRELQEFVALRLAEHKIPRRIVIVKEIPKSATGKLQRDRLAEKLRLIGCDPTESRQRAELVAPRTDVEQALAKIWREVLRIEPLGIHDDFFNLGGDSILAAQIIARVRDALGAELSFLTFFDAPTLAEMAASIERQERNNTQIPPLTRVSRDIEAPLSYGQQRLWFFDQLEPGSPLYNRATFLRLNGKVDVPSLRHSLDEIARRHEVLRTRFCSIDGRPRQLIASRPNVPWSEMDLRGLPEADRESEARKLAIEEGLRPFDLASDLLLRAKFVQLGDQESILILATHHIATDGWSDGILLRELSALYKAHVSGAPADLPDLPIQYADFAVWHRASLTEEVLREQLTYWKQQLTGAPVSLELPTDRARPPIRSFRGARHSTRLSPGLSAALGALSRDEASTLYMTLLAAFEALLWRYSGQDDLLIGTPFAGRTHAQTENLIGVFINTLVLRGDLSGNPAFREVLQRVRRVCLAAYAHADLPFEKLVEAVQPKRDMSRNPLFQVMFQLRNAEQTAELDGVKIEELEFDSGLAKLDLTLELVPRDGALACDFYYNTDLFDESTIVRMGEHYRVVLETLVGNPERRLSDLTSIIQMPEAIASPGSGNKTDAISELSNLTKSQLLIWAGQKLQPETPLYNMPLAFHVAGEIDLFHFRSAFQTLIHSSDALRTVIEEIKGVPQQRVLCNFPYEVEFHDFSNHPDGEAAAGAWMKDRSGKLFQLERGLFDCALVKLSNRRFIWFLNLHHIIADSRAIELIFHHVSEFYQRSRAGCLEERAELPSFKDYVQYERAYRRSAEGLAARNYWDTKLAAPPQILRFYGKKAVKTTTRIEKIPCEVGKERSLQLKQLASDPDISAKTENASLFNIFAATLFTYLYRMAGSREPSIGATFHNRRSQAFRSTIGLLMEVLPLRVAIENGESFKSLVRKIASEAQTAFRNSQSIGNSPTKPVYDVLLNYDPQSFPPFDDAPVALERVHSGHENDSLALRIRDLAGGTDFVIDFEFHCDVFSEGDRRRVIEHFFRILDSFLKSPNQLLDDVDLLSADDKLQILVSFNRSHRAKTDCFHFLQSFEAQVDRTPDRAALVCETESLNFAQLNSRANRLAHYLNNLGVKPGSCVGLHMERSTEMIIGLLGILKAGAAYVPLDPSYPRDRLAFMLRDARIPLVLSRHRLAGGLPEASSKLVCLDTEWTCIAQETDAPPTVEVTSDHPAYVVYTSGSTGRAKGVEITHGALANFVAYAGDAYSLGPEDRVLQFASISFDAAVEEIFPTLARGATLVLRTDSMLDSVAHLLEKCGEWRITVLDLPTAYWHELAETLHRKRLPFPESIRLVILGGDRALPERLVQWQAAVGKRVRLFNTYGPTEGTVVSTACEIMSDESENASLSEVPIGRPIPNIQTYILDEGLHPTPIGVCGELHIGGAGLARGYVHDPGLTARRFVPNPFNDAFGARLYKTGDLGRYLPDGTIEFVGRIDDQVKIRGFRIEPSEIESVLREHPCIRDVVVAAREGSAGGKRLVAYIVVVPDTAVSASELRNVLSEKFPDYMLPAAYVFLQALPLTATGKVDRRALPEPDQSRAAQETPFAAPSSAEEEIIARIWREVLQLQQVGVHDNFFDLGGHSLLAIQVVSRIREAFKIDLPLRILFESPTVAASALRVQENVGRKSDSVEITEILSELESLPDQEAQQLLDDFGSVHKDGSF